MTDIPESMSLYEYEAMIAEGVERTWQVEMTEHQMRSLIGLFHHIGLEPGDTPMNRLKQSMKAKLDS